jgi:hypothetical protein
MFAWNSNHELLNIVNQLAYTHIRKQITTVTTIRVYVNQLSNVVTAITAIFLLLVATTVA